VQLPPLKTFDEQGEGTMIFTFYPTKHCIFFITLKVYVFADVIIMNCKHSATSKAVYLNTFILARFTANNVFIFVCLYLTDNSVYGCILVKMKIVYAHCYPTVTVCCFLCEISLKCLENVHRSFHNSIDLF
jgi:hypothetical protein